MELNIVTLNVCAASSRVKLAALEEFLLKNKVDVAMLQEVAVSAFAFKQYAELMNPGTQRRGTAILVHSRHEMTSPVRLSCGRGCAVKVGGISFSNVYAPAGSRLRAARAEFFATDVTPLMAAAGELHVWAGDFNCVERDSDSTGQAAKCPPLSRIVRQLHFTDAWTSLRSEPGHTYVTGRMSSRLDRVYVSQRAAGLVQQVETVPVSFSDHHAVLCALAGPGQQHSAARDSRPPAAWKLDASILKDEAFQDAFKGEWAQWCARQESFESLTEWWLRLVKPGIRRVASAYTREKRRTQASKMSFLEDALKDIYAQQHRSVEDMATVKDIKAAILELHEERLQGVAARAKADTLATDERVSMFHVVQAARRAKQQDVTSLTTVDGEVLSSQDDIAGHFRDVYKAKFSKQPSRECESLRGVTATMTEQDNERLAGAITMEEVEAAVKRSPKRKSPGEDGIPSDFFHAMFPVIGEQLTRVLNEMWEQQSVPEEMMRGIIVLVPKTSQARVVKDYRPLTLLNADYKVYARVLATRLTSVSDKLLHPNQVRPGGKRTMAGALCDLRDVISALGTLKTPGCVVSVDFSGAFDCVNHDFLFQTLLRRGMDAHMVNVLRVMYSRASSRLRVNGLLTAAFLVQRSVRQGCPLSALLFAVVLAPLLFRLDRLLEGVPLALSCLRVSAYADDAFAVLRHQREAAVVRGVLDDFGAGSGLAVNPQKSAALPVGRWDTSEDIGYPYVTEVKVLGVVFTAAIKSTIKVNWTKVLQAVRGVLAANSCRAFSLVQRVDFVGTFALSKMWHVAQVLPVTRAASSDVSRSVCAFVWRGSMFRLCRDSSSNAQLDGGLGLPRVEERCMALFVGRWASLLLVDGDCFSSEWLQALGTARPVGNPPNLRAVWAAAYHYRELMRVRAYCGPTALAADPKANIKAVYRGLLEARTTVTPRVARLNPAVKWEQVWRNVWSPALPPAVQECSTWRPPGTGCTPAAATTLAPARAAGGPTRCCIAWWCAGTLRRCGAGCGGSSSA